MGNTDKDRSGDWIPPQYMLPATVAAIEQGRPAGQRQLSLFDADDSRAARLRRLLGIPGVTTADRLGAGR